MSNKVKKASKAVAAQIEEFRLDSDGKSYLIDSEGTAHAAVEAAGSLTERIDKIKATLTPLEAELALYRKGLNNYQVTNRIADIVSGKWRSALVERSSSSWIFEESDIPTNLDLEGEEIIPLHTILRRKFRDAKKRAALINRITKRVIVSSEIDSVVKEGILSANEVEPAFLQYVQTSYVQVKEVK